MMSTHPRSMTGFGQGAVERPEGRYVVEMKSVNGRHLDIRVRAPSDWLSLEPRIVAQVKARLARGQVDINVRYTPSATVGAGRVWVDDALAAQIAEAWSRVAPKAMVAVAPNPWTFDSAGYLAGLATLMASTREVIVVEHDMGEPEARAEPVLQALDAALSALIDMRTREGAALLRTIEDGLARFTALVDRITAMAPEVVPLQLRKLSERLAALKVEVSPERLAQEVVMWADRCDVSEELDRLRSHLAQFGDTLRGTEPAGRKLDFLLQELNREINTTGSKANHAPLTALVVEAKTELERIREQIQNLE